jgi:acyl transferase domain-containing protein/NADPH:quinone reductase-like Zn-dependent oxidoreductase/acyl carrier protein
MTNPTPPPDRRALMHNALQAIDDMQSKLDGLARAAHEPIAIVGMSCRFPGGANSPDAYWELLRDGRDVVSEYPADRRAKAEAAGIDLGMFGDATWYGGFIDQIDQFDAPFFGISPREAATMDPQQRMALELSWEALERAGIAPDSLNGSATGVFLGITTNEYVQLAKLGGPTALDVYSATGGALNAAAGRVAYTLGLQGPCLAIDTACSSSLVALHQACQSLRLGESNLALAGGVNLVLLPEAFVCFERWGMMAPDGRCKTFDTAADGFVRGEGCGILVLKRLSDALADGDPVLATIRGSAVNQDGRSSGLTVPNGLAQQAVIRQALTAAEIEPADVQYFEAHGTGTTLGDPIEVEAMGAVLGQGRRSDQPLLMGSVKTNLGHLESASGIAGVIKVVLSMQHHAIPAHLHFHEPNPQIPWPNFPITIPTTLTEWPAHAGRHVAGVSGFGFSGTNAHVVLESAPATAENVVREPVIDPQLLTLSAKTEPALRAMAGRIAAHLVAHPETSLVNVCTTLNGGRARFTHRLALVAATNAQMRSKLESYASEVDVSASATARAGRRQVAFLFTGQGAQYAKMSSELYEAQPVFRSALDRCFVLFDAELPISLADVVFAEADDTRAALLDQTMYTQPALFAVEYALSELWRSWGVVPHALLGHSVGEYVAAVVAGVFDLEDGVRLIAARGRLMQELSGHGAMAAVFAPVAQVEHAIEPFAATVAIAAVNGPAHTVVAGSSESVDAVVALLAAEGMRVQKLTVSHAFHSPLMEPMLADFAQVAATVAFHAPQIAIVSNRAGDVADASIATPEHWVRHVRDTVQFSTGITTLQELGIDTFIEIGPHPVLLGMGQACVEPGTGVWLPSLRRRHSDLQQILESVGGFFAHGGRVDWEALRAPTGRRVALPTYPFEHQRHWLDPVSETMRARSVRGVGHELLGEPTHAPMLDATIYETKIDVNSPSWLADHRLAGTVIFPGTGYLEMVLAAAGTDSMVDSLLISEPLVLTDDREVTLQTMVVAGRDDVREVHILSVGPSAAGAVPAYKVHARATVRTAHDRPPQVRDLVGIEDAYPESVDVHEYYDVLRSIGLTYGPAFRGLTRLMRRDGAAIGLVTLATDGLDRAEHHLHPALLDACFHVLGVAVSPLGQDASEDLLVPVAIDGVHLHRSGATSAWCAVAILEMSDATPTITARLEICDRDGVAIATVDRLTVRRTHRSLWQRLAPPPDAPLYELAWRSQTRAEQTTRADSWLIFADRQGYGAALAERLASAGSTCTTVVRGATTIEVVPGEWQLQLDDPASVAHVVDRAFEVAVGTHHVVYLWGLDAPSHPSTAVALEDSASHVVRGALLVAQSLASRPDLSASISIVTQGAQSVEGEPAAPLQASLWAFARVIVNEHPQLRTMCIDLDPAQKAEIEVGVDELVLDLCSAGDENQIAHRGGRRTVARLTRRAEQPPALAAPYQLQLARRGSLDDMAFVPLQRRAPGPGEVEVEVRATGVNFRDVLNVLGMYPGDPGMPGLECAGVVVEVGAGVTDLAIGDQVMGIAPQAFDSHVVTSANLVVRKPEALTFAESATLPIAFLTAAYGLQRLARLEPGERVLIHAAAGGVGLAAVQIAQRIGAEVYATVGSAEKRHVLEALGVRHVYNSRTLAFSDEILRDTGGVGVDVVLNSLADDFITHSFAALAPRGRFLEIGKRGIWTASEAAAVRPDGQYHAYDLNDFLLADPEDVHASLQAVVDAVTAGAVSPLPLRAFAAVAIDSAFRYMAQARHIGKVVLTHAPSGEIVRLDGTYLVTGGLGGLGLAVAGRLAALGARNLVLCGRRDPTDEARAAIASLERSGTRVQVVLADVAVPEGVARVLAAATDTGAPLRGVFHAAGVLDDGALTQQSWARFADVLAPKVSGAWLLHQATRLLDLDHFVLFSSASALLGAPGQSSYAAANGYLDALAHQRRSAGLPGLSINWGAWADVGMAAGLDAREQRRLADRGVGTLSPDRALDTLELLLGQRAAQVAVLSMDWSKMFAELAVDQVPALLFELAPMQERATPRAGRMDFASELASRDAGAAQFQFILGHIKAEIVAVLRLDPEVPLDADCGLSDLGMDSLMAVELSNRLQRSMDVLVAPTIAFEWPTLRALAGHLVYDVLGVGAEPIEPPHGGSADAAHLLRIEQLKSITDDEAERSLLEELERSGY